MGRMTLGCSPGLISDPPKHTRRARQPAFDARESAIRHRRAIGKGGRQVEAAIAVARRRLIVGPLRLEALRLRRWNPKVTHESAPAFGTFLSYLEFGSKSVKMAFGRVWETKACNDPQVKTCCWVIFERCRSEREKDRRLGRFLACPLELVQVA